MDSAIGGGGAAVKPALSGRRATLAAKLRDANHGRAFSDRAEPFSHIVAPHTAPHEAPGGGSIARESATLAVSSQASNMDITQ
jgi:hypothetical protein